VGGHLIKWYWDDCLHRENDRPAVIGTEEENPSRWWYWKGHLHRNNDQPAIILHNGAMMWYCHGLLHRANDLPASTGPQGALGHITTEWRQYGALHRDNDAPAQIIQGERMFQCVWMNYNRRHRERDQPAQIKNEVRRDAHGRWYIHMSRTWFVQGQRHRFGAPAHIETDILSNSLITLDYYWFGNLVSESQHARLMHVSCVLKSAVLHNPVRQVWRWRLQRWVKRMIALTRVLHVRTLCETVIEYL
jgi:hypothetical protein